MKRSLAYEEITFEGKENEINNQGITDAGQQIINGQVLPAITNDFLFHVLVHWFNRWTSSSQWQELTAKKDEDGGREDQVRLNPKMKRFFGLYPQVLR